MYVHGQSYGHSWGEDGVYGNIIDYANEEVRNVVKERGTFKGGIPNIEKFKILISDGVKYQGEMDTEKSLKQGYGTEITPDGGMYQGYWK